MKIIMQMRGQSKLCTVSNCSGMRIVLKHDFRLPHFLSKHQVSSLNHELKKPWMPHSDTYSHLAVPPGTYLQSSKEDLGEPKKTYMSWTTSFCLCPTSIWPLLSTRRRSQFGPTATWTTTQNDSPDIDWVWLSSAHIFPPQVFMRSTNPPSTFWPTCFL